MIESDVSASSINRLTASVPWSTLSYDALAAAVPSWSVTVVMPVQTVMPVYLLPRTDQVSSSFIRMVNHGEIKVCGFNDVEVLTIKWGPPAAGAKGPVVGGGAPGGVVCAHGFGGRARYC